MTNTRQNETAFPHWQSFNIFPNLTGPQNITFNSFYFFCAKTNWLKIPFSFPTAFLTHSQLTPMGNSKAQPEPAMHGCAGMQGTWSSLFLVTWNHQNQEGLGDGIVPPPASCPQPVPSTGPTAMSRNSFTCWGASKLPPFPKAVTCESQASIIIPKLQVKASWDWFEANLTNPVHLW